MGVIFDGGPSAIAFGVAFNDCGVVDDAIDRRDGHGGIREDLVPLAERLIAGDDEAAAFVTLGDELEENGRFGLVFANIAEIIEDKGVVAVELCKSCRQGEIAACRLKLLDHVGGSGEQDAFAILDQRGADCDGEMGFTDATGPEEQDICALIDPRITLGEGHDVGFTDAGHGVEIERHESLSVGQTSLFHVTGDAA